MRTLRMAAMEKLMAAGVSRASAKASTFALDYFLADGSTPLMVGDLIRPDPAWLPFERVEAAVLCGMSSSELAGLSIGVRMRGGDLLSADMGRVIDDSRHRSRCAGLFQYADEKNSAHRPSKSLHQELLEFSACIESHGDDGLLRRLWSPPKPPITVPHLVPTMAQVADSTPWYPHAHR